MLKDLKNTLAKTYPYKLELHAHTKPASPCGDAPPEELVQLYLDAGFDGVVITNHFSHDAFGHLSREEFVQAQISDYQRAVKAAEGTKLKVYLGVEARFDECPNDYLIYGVNEEILGKVYDYLEKGLAAFREEVQLPGSVLIQAHPFRNGCIPMEGKLLDGMEVFNMHPNHNSRCVLAAQFAERNGLSIITGGSDFHHIKNGHVANTALRCRQMPGDSFGVAELLKSGDYILEIGDSFIL